MVPSFVPRPSLLPVFEAASNQLEPGRAWEQNYMALPYLFTESLQSTSISILRTLQVAPMEVQPYENILGHLGLWSLGIYTPKTIETSQEILNWDISDLPGCPGMSQQAVSFKG